MAPRPPLDELISLLQSTVAAEGTTTAPGAAAGNSFIDAGLIGVGDNSFLSMLAVLYPGQPRLVDSFDITGFDDLTGEVTLSTAYKGVAAPIPAGVPYKIVTFRFVPAEVAAIAAALAAHEAAQAISRAALGTHDTDIKALLAAIAGYIDTEVDAIKTQTDKIAGKMLFRMVKWSEGKVQVQIDAAGATTNLPTITIAKLPATATVVEAHLMFKFRMIENKYAGVNNLNGATVALTSQVFQIQDDGGGAWADGINLVDNFFTLADAAREGGDVIIGTLNVGVANVVDGNDIYNVRLFLGKADQDFINFDDCQVGLDIWYSV